MNNEFEVEFFQANQMFSHFLSSAIHTQREIKEFLLAVVPVLLVELLITCSGKCEGARKSKVRGQARARYLSL